MASDTNSLAPGLVVAGIRRMVVAVVDVGANEAVTMRFTDMATVQVVPLQATPLPLQPEKV